MKFAQATAVRLAHWLTRAGLLLGIIIGVLDLTGCAGVAVQQFEADWKVGVDQEVKNVCANDAKDGGLSECLNWQLGAAILKSCAKTNYADAACQQVRKDANRDGFWENMKANCARDEPTACMIGKEYVKSGYSEEWLGKQILIGGKRGEVATRVKNRKAAELLRAETQDNQNASLGLLIGLTAAAAGAAAATPVYYPAPVLPYYSPPVHCTSHTSNGTTSTSCY